jgi:hypothetical protein
VAKLHFPFRFEDALWVRPAMLWFWVADRDRCYVEVGDGVLHAQFGPWKVHTPISNVTHAHTSGPFKAYRAVGLRWSFSDHGVTFGSATTGGVCIEFRDEVAPTTLALGMRHPNLTVTVEDPEGLVAAILAERDRAAGDA